MAATQLLSRTLLAGLAVAGSVFVPATATAAPQAPSQLRLTVAPAGEPTRTALLTCSPAGGTHPDASSACGALTSARGNFREIDTGRESARCPMVYSPVSVRAEGRWRGTPVVYQETFDNTCLLSARTGAVFRF